MGILLNVVSRVVKRALEVPVRGLPKLRSSVGTFDQENGTDTSGIIWLTNLRSRNFANGLRYEPCDPELGKWAIENAGIEPSEFCFIDVGCGKGRPLLIASHYGFAQLVGVEYSAKLCRCAEQNLRRYGVPPESFRIVCQDATEFVFSCQDTFAFFNHPFGSRDVLYEVLDRLREGTAGCRIVVAYGGDGRLWVATHGWLSSIGVTANVELFRNF